MAELAEYFDDYGTKVLLDDRGVQRQGIPDTSDVLATSLSVRGEVLRAGISRLLDRLGYSFELQKVSRRSLKSRSDQKWTRYKDGDLHKQKRQPVMVGVS
jgi:hypothetical protein